MATVTVTYNPPPPTVSISSPYNGQTFTTSPITVSGTATDTGGPGLGTLVAEDYTDSSYGSETLSGTSASYSVGGITLVAGANVIDVLASDNAGTDSNMATVTVTYNPPPPTPTGLSASTTGLQSISVAWNANGATSYTLDRSTSSSGPWGQVYSGSTAQYADSGLQFGTPYYYEVSASNSSGTSPLSSWVSATTWSGVPTGLSASPTGARSILVTWNQVTGATTYTLDRSASSGGPWTLAYSNSACSYTDSGLQPNTTYYYEVKSATSTGSSVFSSWVSATTPSLPVPTITWPTPAPITYGTPLGSTQLDASASVGGTSVTGTFAYNPPSGTVLNAGAQTLSLTFTPTDTTDYSTATGSTNLTVNQAALTITAAANTKTYDGTTAAAALPTVSGLRGSDSVTGLAEAYNTRNAGAGETLTVTAYTVNDGNNGGNYAAATISNNNGVINKAALSITAVANAKTYDGTTGAAAVPTVSGLRGGDTVTGLAEAYNTKNAGTGETLIVTGYTVNDGNNGGNYSVSTNPNANGVINKAPLTVTAATNTKTYDGTTSAAAVPTVSGLQGSDSATGLAEAYNTRNAGTNETLTVTTYTVNDGNGGGDYAVTTNPNANGVINKAALGIAAVANTKTYDGTTGAAAVPTVSGLQASDSVTALAEAYNTENVGTGETLAVTGYTVNDGNNGGNYAVTTNSNTNGVINKAALIITAAPNTKTYDGTTGAAAVPTVSGLRGSDTVTGLAEAYNTKNTGTNETLSVTAYTVNDGNIGGNYSVSTNPTANGVINKAPLTITAATNTKTYDGTTSAAAVPTVSGLQGSDSATGLAEAYNTRNAGTNETLTVTTYTVNDGNGGGNYAVTTNPNANGVINKAPLNVTAVASVKTYDGTTYAAALPTISPGLATGDTPNFAETYDNKNVATGKTLTPLGSVIDGSGGNNYSVAFVSNTNGTITARTLTVTATGLNKPYDGTTAAGATLLDNRVPGDVFSDTCTGASFADKNVGTGKVVTVNGITMSGTDAGNYSLFSSTANATANITARTLTVTATGVNKIYDGTTVDAGVALLDNRVSGDVLTDSYTTATFADKNVGTGKAVTVSGIKIGGTDAGNYQLAATTARTTANITARAITVAAVGYTKTYDGTTSAAVVPTITGGLAMGDTANFTETYDTKNMGTGKTLTAAGSVIDGNGGKNYSVTFVSSTAGAITARPLTVTATGVNKVFDFTTAATVTLGDNRVAGDQLITTYVSATFADPNVGTGKTVAVTGIAISGGGDAGNYALLSTSTTTTANVTPAPIGPITSGVTATPSPTRTAPKITALESDANSGNYTVTAAEYFIDGPGTPGKGIPMKASDGKFNGTVENVVATMNATTFARLTNGLHTIYVHAKDASGRWGSFVSATFTKDTLGPVTSNVSVVPNPANTAPTLSATVSDATTGDNNVVAVEYFIDKAAAAGRGTAVAVTSPSPTVSVSAVLSSIAFGKLKPGKHTIYVHGEDAVGNWGKLVPVPFTKSKSVQAAAIALPAASNATAVTSGSVTQTVTSAVSKAPPAAGGQSALLAAMAGLSAGSFGLAHTSAGGAAAGPATDAALLSLLDSPDGTVGNRPL